MVLKERYYMGVDLGTVNSILAFTDEKGDVYVQHWENGETKFPSVLLMTPRAVYAGLAAIEQRPREEKYHFESNFKRMLGTNHHQKIFEVDYTITEYFAMILGKMIRTFNKEHEVKVDNVVISVPADFGNSEREAMFDAASIVGLKNIELINESDAASIAFCYDNMETKGKVAVYDMGGSTFNVTVLEVTDDGFNVLSNEGSKYLGGRDWDLHLASIMQKKIVDRTSLTSEDLDSDSDFRKRILEEAERHKIILDRVETSIGKFTVDNENIEFYLTRNELDMVTISLVEKTIEMTKSAVEIAGMADDELTRIILVGGASVTPLIKTTLEKSFPKAEIIRYDPINSIARGAAIYAKSIFTDGDIKLTSVLNKTYGIKMGVDGEEVVCNILFRNVPLPLKRSVICRPKADDQKELHIEIYENKANTDELDTSITDSRLVNIFSIPLEGRISRGKTKIYIDFEAEPDGRVSVAVECNGNKTVCELKNDEEPTNEQLLMSMIKVRDVL